MAAASGVVRGAAVLALVAALSGCVTGSPLSLGNENERVLTVGSLGTPENEILAQIYGQALEHAGYAVRYRQSIGGHAEFLDALGDGSLDLVVDYAGQLIAEVGTSAPPTSIEAIEAALPAALKPFRVTALHAGFAESTEVLVVTADFAAEHALSGIADLAPIASGTTLGADGEFEELWADDLSAVYGIDGLSLVDLGDGGGAVAARQLRDGIIDVALLSSSDPAIAQNELVVLPDSANVFPDQNVLPLLGTDLKAATVGELLDAVSVLLSTADLAALNEAYLGDDQPSAAELAAAWLASKGLVD